MCRAKCVNGVCVVCDGDVGWNMSSGRWLGRIRSVGVPNIVGAGRAAVQMCRGGIFRHNGWVVMYVDQDLEWEPHGSMGVHGHGPYRL